MYLFPKDPKLRKIWTVRLKRDGFQPSQYTKLCERHFEKDQFVVNPDLAVSIGFQTKAKILIQGAVPSIFDHSNPKTKHGSLGKRLAESPAPHGRVSTALEKRRRKEVCYIPFCGDYYI